MVSKQPVGIGGIVNEGGVAFSNAVTLISILVIWSCKLRISVTKEHTLFAIAYT